MAIKGTGESDGPSESAWPPPTARRSFPPQRGPSPATLVVLVIGLLAVAGFGYGLWIAATSHSLCTGCPRGVGVVVAPSADGLSWSLTFTSVPTGLTPSATFLALSFPNGTALLPGISLSTLTGGNVPLANSAGTLYLEYHGQFPGRISAGDAVSIGTSISGPGTSTTGCVAQLETNGLILYQGTLG